MFKVFKRLKVIIAILSFGEAEAQERHHFQVDRPDKTDSHLPLYRNRLQFETGLERHSYLTNTTWSIPNFVVRYGLSQRVELRAGSVYGFDRVYVKNRKPDQLHSFSLGTKVLLREVEGYKPGIGLGFQYLHTNPPYTNVLENNLSVSLLMQNDFGKHSFLGYNLGYERAFGKENIFYSSLSFNHQFGTKTGAYFEYWNSSSGPGMLRHGIDYGFSYLLGKMVQADAMMALDTDNTLSFAVGLSAGLDLKK